VLDRLIELLKDDGAEWADDRRALEALKEEVALVRPLSVGALARWEKLLQGPPPRRVR
jgi:hypothetical protein